MIIVLYGTFLFWITKSGDLSSGFVYPGQSSVGELLALVVNCHPLRSYQLFTRRENVGMALGSLDRLPREIFDLLLGYLGGQSTFQKYSLELQRLTSLCLVCRHLCGAVQPILYQEFMLGYGDSWRSDLYTWHGRLSSFMWTVAHRRDLAALVKRIYIHPYLVESFGKEKEVLIFDSMWHKDTWKFLRRNPQG